MSNSPFAESGVRLERRLVPELGIELPFHTERLQYPYDPETPRKIEDGVVWIPLELLERLAEQDIWDSQFGSAFIDLDYKQEAALIALGVCVKETRGGTHGNEATKTLMKNIYEQYEELSRGV